MRFRCANFFSESKDIRDCLLHGGLEFGDCVVAFPVVIGTQMCEEESGNVFGVGCSKDICAGLLTQFLQELGVKVGETGNYAIVHENISSKDERVIVRLNDRCQSSCSSNMGEYTHRARICGQCPKIQIIQWRSNGLVRHWMRPNYSHFEICFRIRIIPDAKP